MMKTTLLTLLLSLYSICYAQNPGFQWINFHGDDISIHPEVVNDIQTDRYGNVYVAGQVNDLFVRDSNGNNIQSKLIPGLDSLYNNGFKDVWLAKYSPSGQLLWHRYAGSGSNDTYYDMVADQNGNCYVSGELTYHNLRPARSFGRKLIANDSLGTFIAKVDSAGNLLWHKPFGGDTINNFFRRYLAGVYNLSLDKKKLSAFILGGGGAPFWIYKVI